MSGTRRDIFGLQENALMVKGEDVHTTTPPDPRPDHGAARRGFNGVIGFSLCVFAWGATLRRERSAAPGCAGPSWRCLSLLCGRVGRHGSPFWRRRARRFTLHGIHVGMLAVVGAWLVWKPQSSSRRAGRSSGRRKQVSRREDGTKCYWRTGTGRGWCVCLRFSRSPPSGMVVDRSSLWRTGRLLVRFPGDGGRAKMKHLPRCSNLRPHDSCGYTSTPTWQTRPTM